MKTFYDVIKAKVQAGQYILSEMFNDLGLAYEKSYITLEQFDELKTLAETCCDVNYVGNKFPTAYDLDQDVTISTLEASIIELYEIVLGE